MDRYAAAPFAQLRLGRISWVQPMAGGRWLVQRRGASGGWRRGRREAGELLVVDDRLEPVWQLRVPDPPAAGCHAVSDDLSTVRASAWARAGPAGTACSWRSTPTGRST
jgi:hypothetical protein